MLLRRYLSIYLFFFIYALNYFNLFMCLFIYGVIVIASGKRGAHLGAQGVVLISTPWSLGGIAATRQTETVVWETKKSTIQHTLYTLQYAFLLSLSLYLLVCTYVFIFTVYLYVFISVCVYLFFLPKD